MSKPKGRAIIQPYGSKFAVIIDGRIHNVYNSLDHAQVVRDDLNQRNARQTDDAMLPRNIEKFHG